MIDFCLTITFKEHARVLPLRGDDRLGDSFRNVYQLYLTLTINFYLNQVVHFQNIIQEWLSISLCIVCTYRCIHITKESQLLLTNYKYSLCGK